MKPCPECRSPVADEAKVCSACGERVEGVRCPDCATVVPEEARKCRWCGFSFGEVPARLDFEPFAVRAQRLPTFLQRGRFLVQSMRLDAEKIVISTPGLFGLSTRDEVIPWHKVAGFDYLSGIFWDRVSIETRGQSSNEIPCLSKADGARMRHVLQQLEQ